MDNLILVSPPNYHFNGKLSKIESDIFYHFKETLTQINQNVLTAKFILKNENFLQLDLEYLKNVIKKNSIIFIDGNIALDETSNIYPIETLKILKDSGAKIVCFVPDLIKNLNFKNWVYVSDIILSFSKDAVDWANNFYRTSKFFFYPSIPIKSYKLDEYSEFVKRPYDIGYIGSDKNFRLKFLTNLTSKSTQKIKTKIIYSNRNLDDIKTTKCYLDIITRCKYYFCTRASLFEKYYYNFYKYKLSNGRFAGRVSEALSCGSIPLYWQPLKGSYFTANLRKKFLFSKKNIFFNNIALEGEINGDPYDDMDKNLKNGITVVKNVDDAIKKITNHNKDYIMKKLEYGNKIHQAYVSPKSFFNFVKDKIK